MQLTDWPTEFCKELVSRGYRVVICGNPSKFDGAGVPDVAAVIQAAVTGKPAPPPCTLYDMADDAVSSWMPWYHAAHGCPHDMSLLVIAQIVATNHPEQTIS